MLLINARNQRQGTKSAALSPWMSESRLDGMLLIFNATDPAGREVSTEK